MEKRPKVVVAGVIEDAGKILLIKELLENNKEHWIIPGGGVEFGETMNDAVKREMKEELGIDVEPVGIIDFKEHMNLKYDYHTVIFFFRVKPASIDFKLEDKIIEAKFFTPEDALKLDLVYTTRWFIEKHIIGDRMNHLENNISTTSPSTSS